MNLLALDNSTLKFSLKEVEGNVLDVLHGAGHDVLRADGVDEVLLRGLRGLHLLVDVLQLEADAYLEDLVELGEVKKVLKLCDSAFFSQEVIDFTQIREDFIELGSVLSGDSLFVLFNEEVKALLCHHSVVSLKSNTGREVINKSWNTRPCRVASTSKRLSDEVK